MDRQWDPGVSRGADDALRALRGSSVVPAQLCFPWGREYRGRAKAPNRFSLAPEVVEGGAFEYASCPEVFLERTGVGPLRMAWDTNVLSDYADFGFDIWEADFDPPVVEPRYRAELVALCDLMSLWMMRDIRIRVPERQINDSARDLDPVRWEQRKAQIQQLQAATACVGLDVDIDEAALGWAPLPMAFDHDGWDESLIDEAIMSGCHVFLTRDGRLLKRALEWADARLAVLSPVELLGALERSGNTSFVTFGCHLLPDSHKWVHVMAAHRGPDGREPS
jgi:hypothetical protein